MAAATGGRSVLRIAVAAAALSLCCAATALQAQTPPANAFVGKWQATFKVTTSRGEDERQADIEITPTGGTWQARTQTQRDPCAGKEVPLAIEEVTDDRFTATVRYSTLADFCKDLKLVMQKDASGKVTGRRGRDNLVLERK